jgi:hypothetical protein
MKTWMELGRTCAVWTGVLLSGFPDAAKPLPGYRHSAHSVPRLGPLPASLKKRLSALASRRECVLRTSGFGDGIRTKGSLF